METTVTCHHFRVSAIHTLKHTGITYSAVTKLPAMSKIMTMIMINCTGPSGQCKHGRFSSHIMPADAEWTKGHTHQQTCLFNKN